MPNSRRGHDPVSGASRTARAILQLPSRPHKDRTVKETRIDNRHQRPTMSNPTTAENVRTPKASLIHGSEELGDRGSKEPGRPPETAGRH